MQWISIGILHNFSNFYSVWIQHKTKKQIKDPRRRNNKDETGIYDAKSESRKEFKQVKIKNARERLKDIPIIEAKERR